MISPVQTFILLVAYVSPPLLFALSFYLLSRFYRPASPWKPAARRLFVSFMLAAFGDAALLHALPVLRLSFGPPGLTWAAFGLARLALFVCFSFALQHRIRPSQPSAARKLLWFYALAQLTLTASLAYGAYIEPFRLTVTQVALPGAPGLNDRPLRIVHLSDMHVERTTQRERLVLQQVQALQPDLIVLTGDYLNASYLDDPQALADAHHFLSQLEAPLGIFAVNGNADRRTYMQPLFAGTQVQLLENSVHYLELPQGEVALVGVSLARDRQQETSILASLVAGIPPETYTVLLYHTPDLAEAAASNGIDLYLAGHTHGGQVRLPGFGAIYTSSVYGKRFEMGHYQLDAGMGRMDLYVSRGLGMEGSTLPRVRFLCPPEIVVIQSAPALDAQVDPSLGN